MITQPQSVVKAGPAGPSPRPPLTKPLPLKEAMKSGIHRTVHAGEVGSAQVVREVSGRAGGGGPSPRSPRGLRWAPPCLSTGRGHAQDREAGARLPHPGGPGPLQQAAAGKHALRGEGPGRGRSGRRWKARRVQPPRGAWAAGLGAAGWGEKTRTDGSWDSAARGPL